MFEPVGYSSSDFFYVSALANDSNQNVNSSVCDNPEINNPTNIELCQLNSNYEFISGNMVSGNMVSGNMVSGNMVSGNQCLELSLCKNKELANHLLSLKTTHSSSETRYKDTNMTWYKTILNTFNLSAGILLVSWYLYK